MGKGAAIICSKFAAIVNTAHLVVTKVKISQ